MPKAGSLAPLRRLGDIRKVEDASGHNHDELGRFSSASDGATPTPEEHAKIKADVASAVAAHAPFLTKVNSKLRTLFGDAVQKGRLKDEKSAVKKMIRKHAKYKGDVGRIHDMAGTRLVFKSPRDFPAAAATIRKNFDVIESETEDYVKNPRDGYRSMHFIVKGPNNTFAEIQLRTPNQTKWADWYHDDVYKPSKDPEKRKLIKENYSTIKDYAQKMSDFYYAQDLGDKSAKQPPCQAIIAATVGCL